MPSIVSNLDRCASYEDADKLFHKPAPRSKHWGDCERPLGNSRQYHYRVRINTDDSYSVYLYSTCMARYSKPEGDTRREQYSWDSRTTSTGFMWHVVRVGKIEQYATTCGRVVQVPMTSGGVVLTLVGDKLDLMRSTHPTQHVMHASDDDKAKRKEFRQDMSILVQMAAIRYKDAPAPVAKYPWAASSEFGPFTGPKEDYNATHQMRRYPVGSAEFIEAFFDAAAHVVAYTKGRAAYDEREAPGVAVLERCLMTWALKTMRINRKNKLVALPMFRDVK